MDDEDGSRRDGAADVASVLNELTTSAGPWKTILLRIADNRATRNLENSAVAEWLTSLNDRARLELRNDRQIVTLSALAAAIEGRILTSLTADGLGATLRTEAYRVRTLILGLLTQLDDPVGTASLNASQPVAAALNRDIALLLARSQALDLAREQSDALAKTIAKDLIVNFGTVESSTTDLLPVNALHADLTLAIAADRERDLAAAGRIKQQLGNARNDFRNSNLSESRIALGSAVGILWNDGTAWPLELRDTVMSVSTVNRPGEYEIIGNRESSAPRVY